MAAEVVGTAFVRIKALTTGLSKDIEKGLKKGIKDADVEGLGGNVGDTFAKGAGEKIKSGLEKSVNDSIKDLPKKVRYRDTNAIGAKLAGSISDGFERRMARGRGGLGALGERIGDQFRDGVLRASDSGLVAGFRRISQRLGDAFTDRFFKVANSRMGRGASSIATTFHRLFDRDLTRRAGTTGTRFINAFTNAIVKARGAMREASKRFSDALDFKDVSKKLTGTVQSIMSGGIIKLVALLMPAILGLGSLILQYATAMVAQLGLVATAAAGAGLAMSAAFASTALAMGPLVLAFKHNSEALEEFKKLGKDIGGEWVSEVGGATQEMLLPGLTDALERTKELIPVFRGFGRQVGETAGEFARYMAVVLTSTEGQRRLSAITKGSAPIFGQFARVLVNLGDLLSRLWEAALPIANQFAEAIGDMTERWAGLINASADNGRLGFTLQIWYDRAKLVGQAMGDLFAAIWDILSVGATSATPFFENFATWASDFREWTSSLAGENRLKQIFDDALEVTHEFNGLVVDIARAMGSSVFEEGGNEGILSFIRTLREDVVPFLEGFFAKMKGTYGKALSDFFNAFGDFISKMSEAGTLNVTLTILTALLTTFTEVLTRLMEIPGFDRFMANLLGLVGAFGALKALGIVGTISSLASAFGTLATALGAALGVSTLGAGLIIIGAIAAAAGIAYLAFKNWDTIVETFNNVRDSLSELTKPLQDLASSIGDTFGEVFKDVDFIGTLEEWGSKFTEFWDAISSGEGAEALDRIIGHIKNFIMVVQTAWDIFGDDVLQVVRGAWTQLSAIIGGAIDIILGAFRLIIAIINGDWKAAWEGVKQIVSGVWTAIYGIVTGAMDTLEGILGGLFDLVTLPFRAIYDFLVGNSIVPDLWDRIVEIFTGGIEAVVGFITELPGKIISGLGNLAQTVGSVFVEAFEGVKNIVSGAVDAIVGFVTELPFRLFSLLQSLIDTGKELGSSIINGIIEGLSGLASKVGGFATSIMDAIKDVMEGIINTLIDGINNLIPNSIAGFSVLGREVFGGIDLDDNPIKHVSLATGGIARRRPGGTFAQIGEGRYDEAVIPLPPGTLDGLRNINNLSQAIQELLAYLRTAPGGLSLTGVTVKLEGSGSGPRDALGMLDSLADAAFLRNM